MATIWELGCDFGHSWSFETESNERIEAWRMNCPLGHPGVWARPLEKADIVVITIRPTTLANKDTDEPLQSRPRFQLELECNKTNQKILLPFSVDWRRLRDLLERIQGQSFAQAIKTADSFPETQKGRAQRQGE